MPDVYTKTKRSEIMSHVRNRRTAPEDAVAKILRRFGAKFRRNVGSLPGQPDIMIKENRLLVFVHGCFWHGHPNCTRAKLPKTRSGFWRRKIGGNRERDKRTVRKLRRLGWRVLTVWQCQLRKPERLIAELRRALKC